MARRSTTPELSFKYIAYLKAMKLLSERLNATPEELAAWVYMGAKDGGLDAFLNANELDPPPRFFYSVGVEGSFDYWSPLMGCWFREEDIVGFEPTDRYISGKTLIERWSKQFGIQTEAFIRAKILESRLFDTHPMFGGTRGSHPEDEYFPPLESSLFELTQVVAIEESDIGSVQGADPSIGTAEWRKENARNAANNRHAKSGGSHEKIKQIREIWATKKYSSRDRCAEEECAALDMSFSSARKALRNMP